MTWNSITFHDSLTQQAQELLDQEDGPGLMDETFGVLLEEIAYLIYSTKEFTGARQPSCDSVMIQRFRDLVREMQSNRAAKARALGIAFHATPLSHVTDTELEGSGENVVLFSPTPRNHDAND